MKEWKTHTSLEKSTKAIIQPTRLDFVKGFYLTTDCGNSSVDDLSHPRNASPLTAPLSWRAFLKRSADPVMALPPEAEQKEQTTGDANRYIHTSGYKDERGIPPEHPIRSEPASLDPLEPHLIHSAHPNFLSMQRLSDTLGKLKTMIETQKPDIPGAISIEAERQRRNTNEWKRIYNRWMERLGKSEGEKLPEAGLKGGVSFLDYNENGHVYARFMTLRDPSGDEYQFYEGEYNENIADLTERWIAHYGSTGKAADGSQFQAGALTVSDVKRLDKGVSINGWECTELQYEEVRLRRVYTDNKETPIFAVDKIPYSIDPGEPPPKFEGIVLGPTNPNYNCYGKLFLAGESVLISVGGSKIQMILDHNGYDEVSGYEQAGKDDILIYKKEDRIEHGALVLGWIEKGKTPLDPSAKILFRPPDEGWDVTERQEDYCLWTSSKIGADVELGHKWDDPGIIELFGTTTFYRTNRPGGNRLLEKEDLDEE